MGKIFCFWFFTWIGQELFLWLVSVSSLLVLASVGLRISVMNPTSKLLSLAWTTTISRWSLMRRSSWVNLWWSVSCRHSSLQVLHYLTWWSSTFRPPHTLRGTVLRTCMKIPSMISMTLPSLHFWRTLFFTWLQRRRDKKRGDSRVHYFLLFYSFLQVCVCPVHHESHVEKKK